MIYSKIDFSNYRQFAVPGRKLMYGSQIGLIESDPAYSDGLRCRGRSVRNILEEYDAVFVFGEK